MTEWARADNEHACPVLLIVLSYDDDLQNTDTHLSLSTILLIYQFVALSLPG